MGTAHAIAGQARRAKREVASSGFPVRSRSERDRPQDIDPEEQARRIAQELEECVHYHGAGSVAAFMATPIGCGSDYGVFPPQSYWKTIREICDAHEILLIADEVVSGFGRTGKWFAMEHFGVEPDLMTIGKGLTASVGDGIVHHD